MARFSLQTALDTSHCAARRLGFSAIPLCAVLVRVLWPLLVGHLPLLIGPLGMGMGLGMGVGIGSPHVLLLTMLRHLSSVALLFAWLFVAKCVLGILLLRFAFWKSGLHANINSSNHSAQVRQ